MSREAHLPTLLAEARDEAAVVGEILDLLFLAAEGLSDPPGAVLWRLTGIALEPDALRDDLHPDAPATPDLRLGTPDRCVD